MKVQVFKYCPILFQAEKAPEKASVAKSMKAE